MAGIKWIKLTTDMFDNRKIKHLRKLPEGNNIVLIWVMLLTMAGRCNASGMIFLTENIPYTTKMLADELDFEENTIKLALEALERFGMIVTQEGFFAIAGWQDHQNIEGMDKIREQTKQRVAKHREKQKFLLGNATSNVTVTQGNATDKEEEKEKEIDKEEDNNTDSKPNRKAAKKVIYFPLDEQLNSTFLDFIEMRKKIKAPMTERAITLMLNKIDKLAGTDSVLAINILEQSILNGWKDVYPLKDEKNNTRSSGEIDWSKV